MNVPFTISLPEEIIQNLRNRAASLSVPISALVGLYMRYGSDRLTDEALKKWSAGRQRSGSGAQRFDMNQSLVNRTMVRLALAGDKKLALYEVAVASGLTLYSCLKALRALQARGYVTGTESADADNRGRPLSSVWELRPRPGA